MVVPSWVWGLTVVGIVGLLLFDFFFHVRKAHVPTVAEAARWSALYISIALLFGIVVSLIARTGFIFLGAALINSFAWVFYIFGLILLITAGNLLKPESEESHTADNFIIRVARKLFHTTDEYDGDKLFTMVNGKKVMTPMLLVMVAIGGTDLLFALDSIPAIVGVLAFTIIASLLSKNGKAQHTASRLKHHATEYVELDGATPAERSALYAQLTAAETELHGLPEKYRAKHLDHDLSRLVHDAHMLHR